MENDFIYGEKSSSVEETTSSHSEERIALHLLGTQFV